MFRFVASLSIVFVASCVAEPQCDFDKPLAGGPGEWADSPPAQGVIEVWTAEKITVRTIGDFAQELSVALPKTAVDIGSDEAIGFSVIVETFHNFNDCFEADESCKQNLLEARIKSDEGVLIFGASSSGGRGTQPIDSGVSCAYLGASVIPGQTTLISDGGDVVSRSGDEHLLAVDGQQYLVQNIASYIDGLDPVSIVAQRAVFPLN